jgi:sugar-specific transcriptional regulator TrmB
MGNGNNVKRVLRVVGLTNLEANVYIKLLQMGHTKVTSLARRTGVTRTQLYPLLEKLVEKGFIKESKGRPTTYSVVEPEKLMIILEKWIKEQNKAIREARKVLNRMKT